MEQKVQPITDTLDINAIYDRLSKIEVPLEIQFNYNRGYIDQKLVECDKALDTVDKLGTLVIRELTNQEIRLSIVDEEIQNRKRNELANNQEILKKYPTGKEREAAIELMLKDTMGQFSKLSRRILALKNLSGVIKTKQSIIIKKMRSIQDQFRMMSDLLKAEVPLPQDKDTSLLMKNLSEVEKLERDLEAEDSSESIEQEETEPEVVDVPSEPIHMANIDIAINDNSASIPSDVTQQKSETATSVESVDVSEVVLSNIAPSASAKAEPDREKSETDIVEPSEDAPSEDEDSELDYDTVLDGLDGLDETGNKGEGVATESSPSQDSAHAQEPEGVILDDVSVDDAVVTDEPATTKPGQGEPTSKEKIQKKETPLVKSPAKQKVLTEENAVVSGELDIDNLIDSIENL